MAPSPDRRGPPWRCVPMPRTDSPARRRHRDPRRQGVRGPTSTWRSSTRPSRAELNARRRGTHSSKTRGEVSRRWRQAVAPEGHRTRPAIVAAGSSRSPVWTGGGTVFGPQPRHYIVKVNRKARRAAPPLRAVSVTPSEARWPCSTRRRSTRPPPSRRSSCSTTGRPPTPSLVVLAESEASRWAVVPQSAPGGGRPRLRRRRRRSDRCSVAAHLAGRARRTRRPRQRCGRGPDQ